jgi:ABC-type nitrate/sulfonate/bicarbonate transport system substrate-binding protein
MWARHWALLEAGAAITVPTAVVAQAWRGGARQALLARLLAGCMSEALDDVQARRIGVLAQRTGHSDIIDLAVAEGALRRGDVVVTSDPDDIVGAGVPPTHVERP